MINNEVMACNPRCNGFNVLCSICWFSFLLWCYDHLCVVTRCEYIHIWEENRKSKQTNGKKKKTSTTFRFDEDAAAAVLWWGRRQEPDPRANRPHSLTGGSLSGHGWHDWGRRSEGLVWYSGNFLALPPMAGENTESPALRLPLSSSSCVVRTSTVKIKEKKRKTKKNNPLLWVCYPSKDTRPLSLWFAVRIELFFFLFFKGEKKTEQETDTSSKTFKELFWIYLEMTPVYIACKFILEYIIMKNYKW